MPTPTETWRTPLGCPRAAGLLLAGLLLGLTGCSNGPQLSGENRELIVALATATSMQDLGLVTANARQIEAKHQAGELADSEYQALEAIIRTAQAGDWTHATEQAYHLRDAQEPTAADIERIQQRKLDVHHHGRKLSQDRRPRS